MAILKELIIIIIFLFVTSPSNNDEKIFKTFTMKILKFGGSSLTDSKSINGVLKIIRKAYEEDQNLYVVCAALDDVTNKLEKTGRLAADNSEEYKTTLRALEQQHFSMVKQNIPIKKQSKVITQLKMLFNELEDVLHGIWLLKELSDKIQDLILSYGEQLSSVILSECLRTEDLPFSFIDGRTIIKTDRSFGHGKINFEATNKLIHEKLGKSDSIYLVTGFVASTEKDETITIGRGGSDYTAALIGSALDVEKIEIYTEEDGIKTADPDRVEQAFSLPGLSYYEAMELSHFEENIIFPPALQPAFTSQIPIYIKNTFNPDFEGTVISNASADQNPYMIKGISSIDDMALINIYGSGLVGVAGISARVFSAMAEQQINVILITQTSSEHSICFAVKPQKAELARSILEERFSGEIENGKVEQIAIEYNLSIIALIGEKMRNTPGIASKIFRALGRNGINVRAIAQGASELNVSVVIGNKDLNKSINALHDIFFLSGHKTLNVFIVGLGLIGSTLIKQIRKQEKFLAANQGIKIRLVGLSNSRKMLFDKKGIGYEEWKDRIENTGKQADIQAFTDNMIGLNLPNSIFLDCTASEEIVKFYPDILNASISIVTPNKVANSVDYNGYKNLQEIAFKRSVKYLYETNVGAGLPIINTLKDLMNSGDQIIKIQAILSGTVSYIFNNFVEGTHFHDIVKEAKEKGLTEPDPREDLNGKDVARKILILSRETGLALEPDDVAVENVLPESCKNADSVDEFMQELENNSSYFEKLRKEAADEGKVLRYIAELENGKVSVSLKYVDAEHPFYSLSGSDNIVSFVTERYKDTPLVVKGPGAGAEVTAAGVFADLIQVGNYLS